MEEIKCLPGLSVSEARQEATVCIFQRAPQNHRGSLIDISDAVDEDISFLWSNASAIAVTFTSTFLRMFWWVLLFYFVPSTTSINKTIPGCFQEHWARIQLEKHVQILAD